MKKLIRLSIRYKFWLLALLKPLGFWGVACISAIDSAAFPVPMDLILAGYIWKDKRHFYIYILLAAAGSALGGLVPFLLGRAGGELLLMKRINRHRYEHLRDRFEKQEFLAMMLPSILPPPAPWKLFVLAAGVFEMRVGNFLLAVFAGRVVRDGITAFITIEYGPAIVAGLGDLLNRHKTVLLAALLALIASGVLGWWLWRRRKNSKKRAQQPQN